MALKTPLISAFEKAEGMIITFGFFFVKKVELYYEKQWRRNFTFE